jgi:mannan endo-1,4-beta-mannosidase
VRRPLRTTALVIVALASALVVAPGGAPARTRDRDHDRMPDRWERAQGLRVGAKDGRADPDRDGLSNLGEYRSRTKPKTSDTDHDCVADVNEDPDRDKVDNGNELDERTRPRDADSDNDRVRDGREDADRDRLSNAKEDRFGTQPDDRDSDNDRKPDRLEDSDGDGVINARDRVNDNDAIAQAQARCRQTKASGSSAFVTRSGTQLMLNGSPYRFTGLNIYNANSVDNCWYTLGSGSGLDTSLEDIGPGKEAFRAWFFQFEATRNGGRDWSAFDHTLAVARRHGVKVIATLVNQWGECEGWSSYPEGYKGQSWYASGYRTQPSSPGMPATYRQWVAEVVSRYRDDPTILAWQLVNEAEARTSYTGSCPSSAPETLRAFAADMSSLVKSIDTNHLLNLGTIGSGQCGATSDDYKSLHALPDIDLCEFHDYTGAVMPGDQWNGLATRIAQCAQLGKPLFVGEIGIETSQVGSLAARAGLLSSKLAAQLPAGAAGVLAWDWRDGAHGGSSGSGYEIGPSDPALAPLGAY